MSGSAIDELSAWEGFRCRNKHHKLIPLTIFWNIWKERNNWCFENKEIDFDTIKDRWLQYFAFIVLEHNLDSFDDFGVILDILTNL